MIGMRPRTVRLLIGLALLFVGGALAVELASPHPSPVKIGSGVALIVIAVALLATAGR